MVRIAEIYRKPWVSLVAAALLVSGCGGEKDAKPPDHSLPGRVVDVTTKMGLAGVTVSHAQSVDRGAAIARANCARCHSIARSGTSPFSEAPPFRTLHQKYPVESLQEALAEGIFTGHPAMPEFQLEPDQIGDFIAFLKSLE